MSSTPNMTKTEWEFIAMGQFREGQWMENYGGGNIKSKGGIQA